MRRLRQGRARARTWRRARAGVVEVVEGDVTDADAVRRAIDGVDGVFHMAVLPLGPTVEQPAARPRRQRRRHVQRLRGGAAGGRRQGRLLVGVLRLRRHGRDDGRVATRSARGRCTAPRKIAGEYFLRAFNDQYGLPYVTLRYMNVYGPRQEGGLVMAVARRVLAGRGAVDHRRRQPVVRLRARRRRRRRERRRDGLGRLRRGVQRRQRHRGVRAGDRRASDRDRRAPMSRSSTSRDARVLMRRRVGSNDKAKRAARLGGVDPARRRPARHGRLDPPQPS